MKRWVVVLLLGLSLPGCDVATAALILGQDKKSSGSDPVLAPPPDPGFSVFKAWVAMITDPVMARADLIAANGFPTYPGSPWLEIGQVLNSDYFAPSGSATSINAILIQVSETQNYALECVEVMDTDFNVIEYANGTTYYDQILIDATSDPSFLLGPPDGKTAVTDAVNPKCAFIFTLFSNPAGIPLFRINGHGATLPPSPGEVVAVGNYSSLLSERPGGMAIDGSGKIHLTLSVGDIGRLVRYDQTGTIPLPTADNNVQISADLATAGTHAVALDPNGVVFTACSNSSGLVQVLTLAASNLAIGNSVAFASGFNSDRVEHNSITVASDGNVVVVGGMNSLLSGRNHWRVKIPPTLTGSPIWQSSTSLDNSNTTYWHAVTPGANGEVFTTGDNLTNLLGGTNQIYSSRFSTTGVLMWEDSFQQGHIPADLGHALELDLNGNLYVAGSVGTNTEGKDGALLRYANGTGAATLAQVTGEVGSGLDDEILDVAVDPADGSIFVVGYITVTGQGENFWVRKYVWDASNNEFDVVWTRTHHGGFGNDRAISCAIYQNNLVVAGYETNSTGQTKLVLRIYAK